MEEVDLQGKEAAVQVKATPLELSFVQEENVFVYEVVRFKYSGELIWLQYPSFVHFRRVLPSVTAFSSSSLPLDLKVEQVKCSQPQFYCCKWDRFPLEVVMHKAGISRTKLLSAENVEGCNLIWAKHPKHDSRVFANLRQSQRFSHHPGARYVTRKDALCTTLRKLPPLECDFFPLTFILPQQRLDLQMFLDLTNDVNRQPQGIEWIKKPAGSSKGSGISLHTTRSLLHDISDFKRSAPTIVQRYITDPLLIDGKKFDIRFYVLVTSFLPLKVYFYPEGLVRFCTEKYPDNSDDNDENEQDDITLDLCAHLTNTSINSKKENYVTSMEYDQGSKWSYSALKKYLTIKLGNEKVVLLQSKIEDLALKTIISCVPDAIKSMNSIGSEFARTGANSCFELFGIDVLLDSNYKPWLLEFNLSPSLGCKTALDTAVKPTLICDALFIVGLPLTVPKCEDPSIQQPPANIPASSSLSANNDDDNDSTSTHSSKATSFSMFWQQLSSFKSFRSLPFGKNRHFISGVKPGPLINSNDGMMNSKDVVRRETVQELALEDFDNLSTFEAKCVGIACEEYFRRGFFKRIFPLIGDDSRTIAKQETLFKLLQDVGSTDDSLRLNRLVFLHQNKLYEKLFETPMSN